MLQAQRTVEDYGFNLKIAEYFMRRVKPYLRNPVLDLGCGVGVISKYVADLGFDVHGVDGNCQKVEKAKKRVPVAKFTCACIDKFKCERRFGTVIMKNLLEHFTESEVASKLKRVRSWLARDGYLVVYVPVKTSLHKRIWHKMGKDATLGELTRIDREVGHQQVYSVDSLLEHLSQAGFQPVHLRGLLVKPFPNIIMETRSNAYCDALFKVAEDTSLVNICSGIFCVCKL